MVETIKASQANKAFFDFIKMIILSDELSDEIRYGIKRKPVSSWRLLLYMEIEFIQLCTFMVYYFDACNYTETVL